MRKIEQAMVCALQARVNWRDGNTAVILDARQDGKPLARVELHGNHIATIGYVELMGAAAGPSYMVQNLSVSLAGWNTVMTRSRLSAIIRAFAAVGPHGLGVSTRGGSRGGRDGVPFLHDAQGERMMSDAGWHGVELRAALTANEARSLPARNELERESGRRGAPQ